MFWKFDQKSLNRKNHCSETNSVKEIDYLIYWTKFFSLSIFNDQNEPLKYNIMHHTASTGSETDCKLNRAKYTCNLSVLFCSKKVKLTHVITCFACVSVWTYSFNFESNL